MLNFIIILRVWYIRISRSYLWQNVDDSFLDFKKTKLFYKDYIFLLYPTYENWWIRPYYIVSLSTYYTLLYFSKKKKLRTVELAELRPRRFRRRRIRSRSKSYQRNRYQNLFEFGGRRFIYIWNDINIIYEPHNVRKNVLNRILRAIWTKHYSYIIIITIITFKFICLLNKVIVRINNPKNSFDICNMENESEYSKIAPLLI